MVQIDKEPTLFRRRSLVIVRVLEVGLALLVLGVGPMGSDDAHHLGTSEGGSVGRSEDDGDDIDPFGLCRT
jgi:hypothetical protein